METLLQEYTVPVILVACLIMGYVIKHTPAISEKLTDYIPLIVAVLGGLLGVLEDGLTTMAIVSGMASGLASTGLHQAYKAFIDKGARAE